MQTVTMGDGCRIACRIDGAADAPVVMLSHSLGASHAMWDAQIDVLTPRYRVVRYDLRGHGASEVSRGAYGLDRLGRDVVELLDALGIERVHFCGLSLGGMIGQWLGYREPGRLFSLTLANTAAYMGLPSAWDERIAAVRSGGMAPMREAILARWFTPEFTNTAAVGAMIEGTDPAGYAGCCAAIRDMDLRPTNPFIAAPTLIIGGLRDPATPPEQAQDLHAAIPQSELCLLDAAHLSNIEASTAFNQAVLAFLHTQGEGIHE
jgi:3-oxoadipate enol-lactonase